MIYNATLTDHRKVCNSCTICIVLLVITCLITISIIIAYFYFHWYLKKDNTIINTSFNTETLIYGT